jgi:precorrin-6A/cobalt-precorrin-6A reductase
MPAPEKRAVLILGGTAEAAALARALVERRGDELRVISSLAGRTANPAPVPGTMRIGGFGGADGLAAYLRHERVSLLIDATHPFAAEISLHARLAAAASSIPRLQLVRPAWRAGAGDRWIMVPDAAAAAQAVTRLGRCAFLSIGARELGAFADLSGVRFLVRTIEPLRERPPLPAADFVIARPPFTLDEERRLLHRYRIDVVVAKASGGSIAAKLVAAREAGIPVVLLERPPAEPGPSVAGVAEAVAWVEERWEAVQ